VFVVSINLEEEIMDLKPARSLHEHSDMRDRDDGSPGRRFAHPGYACFT
jgi:hypothetical protein